MTITPTWVALDNDQFSSAQTTTIGGAHSFTAGDYILVFAQATSDFHTAGLNASFGISDNASTNSITWTTVDTTTLYNGTPLGTSFRSQMRAWISDQLTANETITITVDGNTGGTQLYYYAAQLLTITSTGTLSVVQSDDAGGSATIPTVTFPGTPAPGLLIACTAGINDSDSGNVTWEAAPTNWTQLASAVSSIDGAPSRVLVSTTSTSTTVTDSISIGSGDEYAYHAIGIELAESSPTTFGEGTSSLAVTTAATGTRTRFGAGSSSLAVTASAAGARTLFGVGSSSLAVSASATGTRTRFGAGSSALAVTTTGTGQRTAVGSGSSTLAVTTTATGTRTLFGAGTAALAVTAAATGTLAGTTFGVGSSSLAVTATATGTRTRFGVGTSTLAITTSASGAATSAATVDVDHRAWPAPARHRVVATDPRHRAWPAPARHTATGGHP